MLRLIIGFALGWFAANWYRETRSPMGWSESASQRTSTGDERFEQRAHSTLQEVIEVGRELGEEARTAARLAANDLSEKGERIRDAAEG